MVWYIGYCDNIEECSQQCILLHVLTRTIYILPGSTLLNILLQWNILANPVIWLVNQAGDMSPYPRGGDGDMDRFFCFCKMASQHRFNIFYTFWKINYSKKMLKTICLYGFPTLSVPILIFLFVKMGDNRNLSSATVSKQKWQNAVLTVFQI
jgi:hypothetical protein